MSSGLFAASRKDDLNVPPPVMDNTTRNAALAEDLRLTFLGQGPSTHRSARFAATSKDGLNVPRIVEVNAIEPSDPGLTRGASVPSASVVPGTDVVTGADVVPCHDEVVDDDDWPEARPMPDFDVGTRKKERLKERKPKKGRRNLFKSLIVRGYEVIAESVRKRLF